MIMMPMLVALTITVPTSLPNFSLTPGEADPSVTTQEVCRPGFAKSRRHVTLEQKKRVVAAYHIEWIPGKYEIDHLISLELGGTNSDKNLWVQPYAPCPGAHEKDLVENWLHAQVCSGKITLKEAQEMIVKDWFSIYLKIVKGEMCPEKRK